MHFTSYFFDNSFSTYPIEKEKKFCAHVWIFSHTKQRNLVTFSWNFSKYYLCCMSTALLLLPARCLCSKIWWWLFILFKHIEVISESSIQSKPCLIKIKRMLQSICLWPLVLSHYTLLSFLSEHVAVEQSDNKTHMTTICKSLKIFSFLVKY